MEDGLTEASLVVSRIGSRLFMNNAWRGFCPRGSSISSLRPLSSTLLRVVHITPTYFDDSSVIGGGERYPTELAAQMSDSVDTTLVSFSAERKSYRRNKLKVEVYPVHRFIHGNKVNPLSFRYLSMIRDADVVHIHHLHTLVSDMACLASSLFNKPTFVTDYGGGGSPVLNQKLPVFKRYRKVFAYSNYGISFLPEEFLDKTVMIKGGVDTRRFCPEPSRKPEKRILYVGRILPHKGINYLIEAFRLLNRADVSLRIMGRVYDQDFYGYLQELSDGLQVEFVTDADDTRLLDEYRSAAVTVLPSVHCTYNGNYTHVPELMGFSLLESQACGTPVVCTDAGAMHEFVDSGSTGFVVKQNSAEALVVSIAKLIDESTAERSSRSSKCVEWASQFDWSNVVREHLRVYGEAIGSRAQAA